MDLRKSAKKQFKIHRSFPVQLISLLVIAHGVSILAVTLFAQIAVRHGSQLSNLDVDIPLLIGLSLVYLGSLLRRHKRTAWMVTIMAYGVYLGLVAIEALRGVHVVNGIEFLRTIVLPLAVLSLLFAFRSQFVARSDIKGFRWALRFIIIMFAVALVYGTAGFALLDKSDFHQEIGFLTAVHYTLDQFDLTTTHPLQPYTKRAHLFTDSLSFVSVAAIVYAAFSLFQPLRLRLVDQSVNRQKVEELLTKHKALSEDFFKLWPHDKQYFFDEQERSAVAFHVSRGVALCLGDPAGDEKSFRTLLNRFSELCFYNDWIPALIHVQDKHKALYERHGFTMQRIGQEAVMDLEHFETTVASGKYFRQINNKFTRQGYTCELLTPPHHQAVIDRLSFISKDWLSRGHDERGFAMGYYTPEYMQLCPVMVARDAAGTIQAFVNQIPADFDKTEADFDMLRQATGSLSNINDFLLMNFIHSLRGAGYKSLNLGLCPLAGLDNKEKDGGPIDGLLRFAYANGDRFYSFNGLRRFKAKYEPEWRDRYIAYQGGLRGFSRTATALMRTMRVKTKT